jgi:hypothetical protein
MKQPKQLTTPEEEGIELYPDAMERLERAIKTAARHGPIPANTIKKKRGGRAKPPPAATRPR